MRDSVFFDTNVLVCGFDETDQRKYEIASHLIIKAYEEDNGVISSQVLQRFHVTVTQKIPKKLDLDVAEQTLRDLSLWRVVETWEDG